MRAIDNAVKILGGQTAMARVLGVSQARVWNWVHRDQKIPGEFVLPIEEATDGRVSRYELRPDIFGASPKGEDGRRPANHHGEAA
jgi:DNA-binding transcriptional regulator YdaS (Cro superfamily)